MIEVTRTAEIVNELLRKINVLNKYNQIVNEQCIKVISGEYDVTSKELAEEIIKMYNELSRINRSINKGMH
jgi:hypothetical protein